MVMLFAGQKYYPCGGMKDFQGCFFDTYSAMLIVQANYETNDRWDWWHIICQETLDVVAKRDLQRLAKD